MNENKKGSKKEGWRKRKVGREETQDEGTEKGINRKMIN